MTWQQLANMVRSRRCAPQPRKGYSAWRTTATASRGIGIHAPITNPPGDQVLDVNNRCSLHTRLRCRGEQAAAILLTRCMTLRRIKLRPSRIGAITKAALVLTQFEHQRRYEKYSVRAQRADSYAIENEATVKK
jgi:hypothetical protein